MRPDLMPHMGPEKAWEPEKWSTKHQMIAALHATGLSNKEIAEHTGFSESRVCVILGDKRTAEYIQMIAGDVADRVVDVRTRLELYSNEALSEIVDQMRNSQSEKQRFASSTTILDRAGYRPYNKDESEGGGSDGVLNESLAMRILDGLREAEGIDATYSVKEIAGGDPE